MWFVLVLVLVLPVGHCFVYRDEVLVRSTETESSSIAVEQVDEWAALVRCEYL
jgi:hypothetical protein